MKVLMEDDTDGGDCSVDGIYLRVWAGLIYIVRLIVIDYFSITCAVREWEGCLGNQRVVERMSAETTKSEQGKCAIGTTNFTRGMCDGKRRVNFKVWVCVGGRDWQPRVLIGGLIAVSWKNGRANSRNDTRTGEGTWSWNLKEELNMWKNIFINSN